MGDFNAKIGSDNIGYEEDMGQHQHVCCMLLTRWFGVFSQKDSQGNVAVIEPRPNDSNISTQHIPTLFAQHLQAPAKRSHHLNATDRSIVGRNMLHAFGRPVATCCDMLRVENRTSAHTQAQHCCRNLIKRL